jgi:hypothetical protein
MQTTTYIGIDPGTKAGAIAVMLPDGTVDVHDMPVFLITKAGKTKSGNAKAPTAVINVAGLRDLLAGYPGAIVAIEQVSSMPTDGAVAAFTFGKACGQIEGVVGAMGIPYAFVRPQSWKNHYKLGANKDKDAYRQKALQMFPDLSDRLNLVKHHNRAEALLIANYARVRALQDAALAA